MANWGYSATDGPSTWVNVAPAAAGHNQSPIDIHPAKAQYDATLKDHPLQTTYVPSHARSITNNGKSITVAYDPEGSSLTGGPLKHKYQLAQFHFHWGSHSDRGSEHRIDGKMYASEAHLVHYNTDLYSNAADAMKSHDGLAVLGVFLKAGKAHAGFQKVVDLAHKVPFNGDEAAVSEGYDPSLLLPEDRSKYWTYPGSLTTPPCYESVTWVVFKEPVEVSEEQLNALRSLKRYLKTEDAPIADNYKGRMVENYRPPLALGSRVLRTSFQ